MPLIVVCILCALIGNLCVLLSPRQLGIIVSDLVAGRSPYKKSVITVVHIFREDATDGL